MPRAIVTSCAACLMLPWIASCESVAPADGVPCAALAIVAGDPRLADLARPTREALAGNNRAILRHCPGR